MINEKKNFIERLAALEQKAFFLAADNILRRDVWINMVGQVYRPENQLAFLIKTWYNVVG